MPLHWKEYVLAVILLVCPCAHALTENEANAEYQKDLTAVIAGTVGATLFLVALIICIGYIYYRQAVLKIDTKYETLKAEMYGKDPFGTPGKISTLNNYFSRHESVEEKIFCTEAPIVKITPTDDRSPKRPERWPKSEMNFSLHSLALTESSSFRGENKMFGSLLQSPLKVPSIYSEDFADTSMNESVSRHGDDVFADLNEREEFVVIHIEQNQSETTTLDSTDREADETVLSGDTKLMKSDCDNDKSKIEEIDTNSNTNNSRICISPKEDERPYDAENITTPERSKSFLENLITAMDDEEEEQEQTKQQTAGIHYEVLNIPLTVKRLNKRRKKAKRPPSATDFTRHFSMNVADYSRSSKTSRSLKKMAKERRPISRAHQEMNAMELFRKDELNLGNVHFFSHSLQEPPVYNTNYNSEYISPVRGRNMHLVRQKSTEEQSSVDISGQAESHSRPTSSVLNSRPNSTYHRSRDGSAKTVLSATGITMRI